MRNRRGLRRLRTQCRSSLSNGLVGHLCTGKNATVICFNRGAEYTAENERERRDAYCRRCMSEGLQPVPAGQRRADRTSLLGAALILLAAVLLLARFSAPALWIIVAIAGAATVVIPRP